MSMREGHGRKFENVPGASLVREKDDDGREVARVCSCPSPSVLMYEELLRTDTRVPVRKKL